MAKRYLRQIWIVVAVTGLAGLITAVAPGGGPMPAAIHAEFESTSTSAAIGPLPVSSGAMLVEGRGVGTGTFGKFDRAIGTAPECSAGQFDPVEFPPPQLDDCNNIPPQHAVLRRLTARATYVTKDGSVLVRSRYHEHSENPFDLRPAEPDVLRSSCTTAACGRSTRPCPPGSSPARPGSGWISAMVPVRIDFSAHVLATNGPDGALMLARRESAAGPAETHCNGTLTGPIAGDVIVDDGAFCMLDYATVNGDVHVHTGATLVMQYSMPQATSTATAAARQRCSRRRSSGTCTRTMPEAPRSSVASSAGTPSSATAAGRPRSC